MAKTDMTKWEAAEKKRYLKGRANKAAALLREFYDGEDLETSVGDCLADLMHLCRDRGWDYNDRHDSGRMHHSAEVMGGEHG